MITFDPESLKNTIEQIEAVLQKIGDLLPPALSVKVKLWLSTAKAVASNPIILYVLVTILNAIIKPAPTPVPVPTPTPTPVPVVNQEEIEKAVKELFAKLGV